MDNDDEIISHIFTRARRSISPAPRGLALLGCGGSGAAAFDMD